MRLLIATRNAHKTEEIRAILGIEWEVGDLNAHPGIPSPEETGETFAENAEIKAVAASRVFDGWVLADDSGLEVDALGGAPGVRSARYAGDTATDADNRARLLRELSMVPTRTPTARFRCAMVLAKNGVALETFEGSIEGKIVDRERGEGGFGYDSLFIPVGHSETFAQLPSSTKNALSHRAVALEKARRYLGSTAIECLVHDLS